LWLGIKTLKLAKSSPKRENNFRLAAPGLLTDSKMDSWVFLLLSVWLCLALCRDLQIQTTLFQDRQTDIQEWCKNCTRDRQTFYKVLAISWPPVRFVCSPHLNVKTNMVGVPVVDFQNFKN